MVSNTQRALVGDGAGLWDPDHFPHTRRNPDGDVQPWCYVAETEEGIYWRYCDIPTCHSEWASWMEVGVLRNLGRGSLSGVVP